MGVSNMNKKVESKKPTIAQRDYVAIAAHQLRTPLTTLRWFLGPLLAGEFGELNEEQKKFLSAFSRSTERMIDLVDTILNASRIEKGEIKIKPEPTDICVFAEKIYAEILPLCQEKSQILNFTCGKDIPVVSLDQRLLHEVLSNLLHNAVRYTPEGGIIAFLVERNPDALVCTVEDTGFGIPKEEQGKVFERMFRASNVASRYPDGTGLGLYVARFFTELLGGEIKFESEENKGTTFYVTLPITK